MRGEYYLLRSSSRYQNGSPPHAWGILSVHLPGIACHRFTPTCVGNTMAFKSSICLRSVHPHMRGEYWVISTSVRCVGGSPPHAWGIRETSSGSTASHTVRPHMRGEYWRKRLTKLRDAGSPPHAWGILLICPPYETLYRFTPTCVGNTDTEGALSSPLAQLPQFHE